jgi:hypothetical protein
MAPDGDILVNLRRTLGYISVISYLLKGPGREADHSPPYSDEDNSEWRYSSTTLISLHSDMLS